MNNGEWSGGMIFKLLHFRCARLGVSREFEMAGGLKR